MYPAMLQSMGRYLALGLIALPLAWLGRARLRQLSRRKLNPTSAPPAGRTTHH
jgi:hypothetical protein